ncbi:hypothetical protein K3495_g5302 [Podosphaera aphanis]|nr:hypothetical protein K3495_g5302 [Podosphaera aphanis]
MGDDDIAPILGGEEQAVWPKWNGSPTSFPLYFTRLKIKIAGDYKKLGGNEIIFHSIMDTILETGDHDVELFLAFMKDRFSDRQALQNAGSELQRMRMSDSQGFELFLDDFELKLAQCGGLVWPDEDKIIRLDEAINSKLSNALINVDLSDNNYESWVSPKLGIFKKGSAPSYIQPAVSDKSANLTRKSPPLFDADGDVKTSGINLVALVNALVRKLNSTSSNQSSNGNRKTGNSDKKPRAKCLSRSDANKLIEEERCLRCKKRVHIGKNCPNFKPALRPTVNHTVAGRDNDVNNDYSSAVESLSEKD